MSDQNYYILIDGYPVQVTENVYREYRRAEEKEQYFMRRLKKGRFVAGGADGDVQYIPSREVSLEQMQERDWSFPAMDEAVEEQAVRACLIEKLEDALYCLSGEELALVMELFCLEKSEREASAALNMAKTTLHRKKNRVLKKLRKKLENS